MTIKGLALLAAAFLMGTGSRICFAQLSNIQTVTVEEVQGELTAKPLLVSVPSLPKREKLEWSGAPAGLAFRIEFFYSSPCDPKRSHLARNPATCVILPGGKHDGTYMYQIIKGHDSNVASQNAGPVPMAQVGRCEACRPPLGRTVIGIACDQSKVAKTVPPDATSAAGSFVQWLGLGPDDPQWTVTFGDKTPCERQTLDPKNPVCKVAEPAAQYSYTIKLEGCATSGKGEITVK